MGRYPTQLDMDGMYFRVKRDGTFTNVCLSDMTSAERESILSDRDSGELIRIIDHLVKILRIEGTNV